MIRFKFFQCRTEELLEQILNSWIEKQTEKIEIIDWQYSVTHFSHGQATILGYSVAIRYKIL